MARTPLGLTGWRLLTGILTPFARLVLRQRARGRRLGPIE
jgi:hypothetical protein